MISVSVAPVPFVTESVIVVCVFAVTESDGAPLGSSASVAMLPDP